MRKCWNFASSGYQKSHFWVNLGKKERKSLLHACFLLTWRVSPRHKKWFNQTCWNTSAKSFCRLHKGNSRSCKPAKSQHQSEIHQTIQRQILCLDSIPTDQKPDGKSAMEKTKYQRKKERAAARIFYQSPSKELRERAGRSPGQASTLILIRPEATNLWRDVKIWSDPEMIPAQLLLDLWGASSQIIDSYCHNTSSAQWPESSGLLVKLLSPCVAVIASWGLHFRPTVRKKRTLLRHISLSVIKWPHGKTKTGVRKAALPWNPHNQTLLAAIAIK